MFGPLGPQLKHQMEKRGFEITRPTHIERRLVRSPMKDWFAHDIARFAQVYAANRETLARVPEWLDPLTADRSLWRYGVPQEWDGAAEQLGSTQLNQVEQEITYTDLIAFIAGQMPDLRYLEIGVSVGKNLSQVVRTVDGAFCGLDVEAPNPAMLALSPLKDFRRNGVVCTVDTLAGKRADVPLTIHETDRFAYVQGDQFDTRTWAAMKPRRFNFVFSDGVHTPEALLSELDFLLEHDLLDLSGPFTMYWDDLQHITMQTAFVQCAERLMQAAGRGWNALYKMHGTYGLARLNGLFTTLERIT